jgi:hypothetical protein
MNLTVARCCKELSSSLLFLLSTCCLYGCGNTSHGLLSHEPGQLGAQIQQNCLPTQRITSVSTASNEVKASRQSSHTQHDVATALSISPVGSLLRKSPDSLAARVSRLLLKAVPTSPVALSRTQYQQARTSIFLPSYASKASPASIPISQSSSYGPFVLDGGKEVLFKPVGGQWQARVKDILLAREETLPVVCQKDVATILSALQDARKADVASRIHVLAPDQAFRFVYLGALGLRGGAKKIREKRKGKGKQQEPSNIKHETENSRDGALGVLGVSDHACVTPSMSRTPGNSADTLYEMPIVLSRKTCHYIPLLNKIDMIQSYLMDAVDSFEKHLAGLRENNVEDVIGWQEFIQISVANTCRVVDKLYAYIGSFVVGKITAEVCLHNAIMCRENYLMSHASHIDSWLYEECYELHNIVEGVGGHFNDTTLYEPPFRTPQNKRVLSPLFLENYQRAPKVESDIRALKGAIREDVMSREECQGVHGVSDQLKDCFNSTNSHKSPAYIPVSTDRRLFRLFFPEEAKTEKSVRELKEAIREDMIFRLDTINSIVVTLFNICKIEQSLSEETINLLHHASTRNLWPILSGRRSARIDHPDGYTPLGVLASLLEKVHCNYTTEPDSVLQKIIMTAKLGEARCILNYFKMKYKNDGAALIKAIHFAQTQQWFNNQAAKMYETSCAEASDMIGRIFLPYVNLGIEKKYPEPEKVPGVFSLVSMFDRCRLAPGGQQNSALLELGCLIPEEAGDWQTPTKHIFSANHAYQEVLAREDDPTDNETATEEMYSKWSAVQSLHSAQKAAIRIQKVWRRSLTQEDPESINTATETISEYPANHASGANDTEERAPRILSNKQERILNNLFSDNAQLVRYRDYKNVWEKLGGSICSTSGGSHQELCNVNGDVLGGIFKHNNNQTYGKRCVERLLRRPMRRLMATRNLYIRDGSVVYESDGI